MGSSAIKCRLSESCTGLHIHDPQVEPEDRIYLTYDDWLEREKEDPLSSPENRYAYLRRKLICVYENDPQDCPGLHRAAELTAYCALEKLKKKDQEAIQQCLNKIYAEHHLRGFFLIGDQIGQRWQIVSQISDAVGHFNRGIYICKDLAEEHKGEGVLKVLPTWEKYPQYASREIAVLNLLEGLPDVIQMYESHEPEYADLAPWIITDYCNGGTLQSLRDDMWSREICFPELFLWHVFESLLTAAHACHTGPADRHPGAWDPIFHRDIIMGNIFLKSSETPTDYPTVILADFGCAVTRGEVEELEMKGLKLEDLPEVCPTAIPPEGPVASVSMDVWQIGQEVARLAEFTWGKHFSDNNEPAESFGSLLCFLTYVVGNDPTYMWNLRHLLSLCLSKDPRDRPTAGEVLGEVRKSRAMLMASGKLKFEPLEM